MQLILQTSFSTKFWWKNQAPNEHVHVLTLFHFKFKLHVTVNVFLTSAIRFWTSFLSPATSKTMVILASIWNFKTTVEEKNLQLFQTALKMPLSKYCDFYSYLFQSSLVGLHALYQRNSKWIELVSLVSFVDNGQGNSESEPSQIPHLHVQQSLIKSQ